MAVARLIIPWLPSKYPGKGESPSAGVRGRGMQLFHP